MNINRDIHPSWEISKTDRSVRLRREAKADSTDIVFSNTTIIVELDASGARVAQPTSELHVSHNDHPPANAIELIQWIDQELITTEDDDHNVDEQVLLFDGLAVYRDVAPSIREQANSLYNEYLGNTEKQWVVDKHNLAAATLLIAERLNGRRPQYSDFDISAGEFFSDLSGIRTSATRCAQQVREVQRVLPINIAVLNDPVSEVDRAAKSLELPQEAHHLARKLAEKHIEHVPQASAYKPQTIAGAAIYNATKHCDRGDSSNFFLSQSEVATATGCSPASIGKHYQRQWNTIGNAIQLPKSSA